MKKRFLPIIILFSTLALAQPSESSFDCFADNIHFNEIRIPVSPYASWLIPAPEYCSSGDDSYQYISIDSGATIYYARDLIMGKNGQNGVIRGAYRNAYFYINDSTGLPTRDNGDHAFRMGPYSSNAISEEPNWWKYWLLTKWEIDQHVANFSNPSYIMPPNIETWPAHGDTTLGESYYLAPFHDFNSNGYYDPENGDYPLIKGDKCVYSIFNDIVLGTNSVGLGQQLNIEVHKMMYSFYCSLDSALNYTVFTDHRIINKGVHSIEDLTFGEYLDFDIGCVADDYAGTNVMLGLAYNYNGDVFDQSCGGAAGFSYTSPAQGYAVLKGFKVPDNGVDDGVTHLTNGSFNGTGFNDGIIDNEFYGLQNSIIRKSGGNFPGNGFPVNLTQYWRYLNANWKDGLPLVYGGIGHSANSPTNQRTHFMLPGHSDPSFYGTEGIDMGFVWSEDSLNNQPGDRDLFVSTICSNLGVGEEQTITNMFIYARDRQNPGPHASVYKMEGFVQDIRNYFANNQTPCGETFDYYMAHQFLGLEEKSLDDLISIYPNPTNSSIQISGIEDEVNLRIYDTRGQLLKTIENFSNGTVDLSLFENGIYLIQLELDGQVIVKKIVKQ